jgi:hypothetical protein
VPIACHARNPSPQEFRAGASVGVISRLTTLVTRHKQCLGLMAGMFVLTNRGQLGFAIGVPLAADFGKSSLISHSVPATGSQCSSVVEQRFRKP